MVRRVKSTDHEKRLTHSHAPSHGCETVGHCPEGERGGRQVSEGVEEEQTFGRLVKHGSVTFAVDRHLG